MTATETAGSTCLPRFATPRDERFPTYGTELGEVARRLGTPLMPWQQAAADVALEYDPVTGLLRYDEVDITVPRQSGKTTLTLAKKVHRLTVMARRQGPQRSTYVAQSRLKARKKLEMDFAQALRSSRSFREITNPKGRPQTATQWRLSLNNGSECMQFGLGSFLQIDAPSRTGGHGDTLDDGTIDEAFSQEDDTVEAGMRPSMATRRNAQLWVISTAGDARSAYLYRKILAGRAACASGKHGRVCYIEYSAAEDDDPGDPATWWRCMPALGITITEEFIRGEWDRAQRKGPDGIKTFLRAYLNLWPDVPILDEAGGGAFSAKAWAMLADPGAERGEPVFALDVAPDHSTGTISVVWRRPDEDAQVMLAHHQRGVEGLAERANELTAKWGGRLVVEKTGTAAFLIGDLDQPEVVNRQHFVEACAHLDATVTAEAVRHGNQPELNAAVEAATWKQSPTTGGRTLVRKHPAVSPLVAVALALYALALEPAYDVLDSIG